MKMTQFRLNNLIVHQERLDQIELEDISNEFTDASKHRRGNFV